MPPNLVDQWVSEIKKFTGPDTFQILVLKDTRNLKKTSVEAIREKYDIIIASHKMFICDPYTSR